VCDQFAVVVDGEQLRAALSADSVAFATLPIQLDLALVLSLDG
jgi:hypothetical protein